MKKPKILNKIKNVLVKINDKITSPDFITGFRRTGIAITMFVLCFIILVFTNGLSVFASSSLIMQQDDFHTIDGCWYSLTPSTIGGASIKNTEEGGRYTKYCYSLINDEDKIKDKNSYQYIVNDDDEIYVFEYYTWLDTATTDMQQIAVYSETGLQQQKDAKGNPTGKYVLNNGDNNYVFESIDQYMYYRLYRFIPDWKRNGNNYYYSQNDKLGFDDNAYYGYKMINDDIYKTYKNIDISTQYVFDISKKDVYFYNNISIDNNGNIIANTSGSTDTSERQIINKNDINQSSFVIEKLGDAYVYTDVNGKTFGQEGFNTNMYYKGGYMYIYDTFETDSTEGKKTISAFKIYDVLSNNDFTEIAEKDFNLNSGYSLLTFTADTKELVAKAVRYYDLLETSYEIVQNVSTSGFTNQQANSINSTVSEEYVKNNNGNPTAYNITYHYTVKINNGYDFKVTYVLQNFVVGDYKYQKDDTYTYTLTLETSKTTDITGTKNISEFENASKTTLDRYSDNQKFYKYLETNTGYNPSFSYENQEDKDVSFGTKNVTSTTVSYGDANQGEYIKTNFSQKSRSTTAYKVDNQGTVTASSTTTNYYQNGSNGTCYANKSNEYYKGKISTFNVKKLYFNDVDSEKVSSISTDTRLDSDVCYSMAVNEYEYFGLNITSSAKGKVAILSNTASYWHNDNIRIASEKSNVNSSSYSDVTKTMTVTHDANYYYFDFYSHYIYDSGQEGGISYTIYVGRSLHNSSDDMYDPYSGSETYRDETGGTIEHGYIAKIRTNSGTTYNLKNGSAIPKSVVENSTSTLYITLSRVYFEDGDLSTYDETFGYYQWELPAFSTYSKGSLKCSGYYYSGEKTSEQTTYYQKTNDCGINTTEGTQTAYYWNEIGYYRYYKPVYFNSTGVTIDLNKQKDANNLNSTLGRNYQYFDGFRYSVNGRSSSALNDDDINKTIKGKLTAKAGSNNITSIVIDEINKETGNAKITVTYNATAYVSGHGNISTGDIKKTYEIKCTFNSGSYEENVYAIYKLSRSQNIPNSYTETYVSESKTTERPNLNKTSDSTKTTGGNFIETTNGYERKFVITNIYHQNKILRMEDTTTTKVLYSNSNTESGNIVDGQFYGSDGKQIIYLNKNTSNSNVYRFNGAISNKDVNDTEEWDVTYNIVPDNKNHSNDSSNQVYYKKALNIRLNRVNNPLPDANYVSWNATITNEVPLYSGTKYTYSTQVISKTNTYKYGEKSNNLTSNTVKENGYYSNVSYDALGHMTKGTWNGGYTLPTSYNLFNDVSFYNSLTGYKRVGVDENGYSYCKLNKPITLNIRGAVEDRQTKTYYISYVIDGKVYKTTQTGSSDRLNNFKDIAIGQNGEYTLSQIMVTTDEAHYGDYTKYVNVNSIGYDEKKIAYNAPVTHLWYETEIKVTANITNLSELISSNGSWNSSNKDVKYTFTINDKEFSYKNNEKPYTAGSEYYFDNDTRVRWKSVNTKFGYILNRVINVKKSDSYGFDYLNVTANDNLNGQKYYSKNATNVTPVDNTKNAVKRTYSKDYESGAYVSINSEIGQLSLYETAGYSLMNVFLIYNNATGKYKLVEVSDMINYKYEEYYDNNKDTNDGGINFTYNDKGFMMKNGITYELVRDSNGTPLKNDDGTFKYNEISRDSLVINTDNTLDNLIKAGLKVYSGSKVNASKNVPVIKNTHVVDDVYDKYNKVNVPSLKIEGNTVMSTDTVYDYNDYTINASSYYGDDRNWYQENDRNYIMLLESTVNNGSVNSNGYTNAYYTDSNNNVYRLKNDNDTMMHDYSTVQFKRYKMYKVEGKWVKTSLTNDMPNSNVYNISSTNTLYDNFINKTYKIDNYGAILSVVKSGLGTNYDGKLLGQDIQMGYEKSLDSKGETIYHFVYYNKKENNNTSIERENLLTTNYIAEQMIANKSNSYFDETTGNTIYTNQLLVKREKASVYSLVKKIPYELVKAIEDKERNSLPILDMRYQYQTTDFMKALYNSDVPIFIQGDDLSSMFTIDGIYYSYTTDGYTRKNQPIKMFNGAITNSYKQGILRPGYIKIDDNKYVETIAYNGYIYKLGNIAGLNQEDTMQNAQAYKEKIAKKLCEIIRDSNSKEARTILEALAKINNNDFFTSNLYNISINLKGITNYSSVIEEEIKNKISITPNTTATNSISRNSNYIRIGNACYYKTGTIDDYWSYRGVDTSLEKGDLTTAGIQGLMKKYVVGAAITSCVFSFTTAGLGALATAGFIYDLGATVSSLILDDIGVIDGTNELAYTAYSGLINGFYSMVYLKDIFEANSVINQSFVSVDVGVDGSDIQATFYNLPNTEVTYTNVISSAKSEERKQTEKGLHFYNFSDDKKSSKEKIRFIPCDDPEFQIITTAGAWYQSIFGDMGAQYVQKVLKIAYGKEVAKCQSEYDGIAFSGTNSSKKTYISHSNQSDILYAKNSSAYSYKGQINPSNYNESDTYKYYNVTQSILDDGSRNKYFSITYYQYDTSLPWFSDASNWLGNTKQFIKDLKDTVKNSFRWLWKKINNEETKEDTWRGVKHYVANIYQLPTYTNPNYSIASIEIRKDSDAQIEKCIESGAVIYKIIDKDYSPSTNFNLVLYNKYLDYNVGFSSLKKELSPAYWGFEIYCKASEGDKDFEGWDYENGYYFYKFQNRLSSKLVKDSDFSIPQFYMNQSTRHHINLILHTKYEDDNDRIINVNNLPAGREYVLNIYSSKNLNQKITDTQKMSNTLALPSTDSKVGFDENWNPNESPIANSFVFRTGENLVYNPYGKNLSLANTASFPSGTNIIDGDMYLKNNQYIDYEIQKFIFDASNVDKIALSNKKYSDFIHPVTGKTYRFSNALLMHKYLDTENVSKIVFKLSGKDEDGNIINLNNIDYKLYDLATKTTVATGRLGSEFNNKELYLEGSKNYYLSNYIIYTLTENDKLILKQKYNNIVNDKFINEYLLTNKLVFKLKDTSSNSCQALKNTGSRFTIDWKPYYENTTVYLDYNQNGEFDDAKDITLEGKNSYYNSNAGALKFENAEQHYYNYNHILNDNEQKWTNGTISNGEITLKDLLPFKDTDNYYQLCLYKDGEAHITK